MIVNGMHVTVRYEVFDMADGTPLRLVRWRWLARWLARGKHQSYVATFSPVLRKVSRG